MECSEDDPEVLAALDEAIEKADAGSAQRVFGKRSPLTTEQMDFKVIFLDSFFGKPRTGGHVYCGT